LIGEDNPLLFPAQRVGTIDSKALWVLDDAASQLLCNRSDHRSDHAP
jgi:hypothetical protein